MTLWVVVAEYAMDSVGPATVVEADGAEDAATKGWATFEREAAADTLCQHCERPFDYDVIALPLVDHHLLTRGERYFVLKDVPS